MDEVAVRLFQREVETLARLKHPNIAAIHESGRTMLLAVHGALANLYGKQGRADEAALWKAKAEPEHEPEALVAITWPSISTR